MSGIKAGALGCFRACVCGTDFAVHAVAIGYPSTTASCRAKTKPKGVVRRGAVTGGGWTAVGDAAGRVDPITGEGIYYTLRSGDLAAQS